MKVLFHLGHPAHYHLFKHIIWKLEQKGHKIFILIKKKDVLEKLLKTDGLNFHNILPHGRKDSKVGIAFGQLKQDARLMSFCIKKKPDILIGSTSAISHIGKIMNIPSLNFAEDDAKAVPLYAKLAYPWASHILAPSVCSVGKWNNKKISYNGYHELAYLHPKRFSPDKKIVEKYFSLDKPIFILRFSSLNAYHDTGVKGISDSFAMEIIKRLRPYGEVYIISERQNNSQLKAFHININPIDMHHVLSFASLYIGDSQTMAAEAGVLGTPFIRYNDFVGRLSYLHELENIYKLGYGIKPDKPQMVLEKIDELMNAPNLDYVFQKRKEKMIDEKIDLTAFVVYLIENYPRSVKELKDNSNNQYRFK